MTKYAIIENNKVINTIVWDGDITKWSPSSGQTTVKIGDNDVEIGFNYNGSIFSGSFKEPDWKGEGPDDDTDLAKWSLLRTERSRRLQSTDWSQGADVPDVIKNKWKTYRQALRDLPSNTLDPLNPTWPEEPS